MPLHNRVNNRILKAQLKSSDEDRVTLSFYRYCHLADPKGVRDELYVALQHFGACGRIYLAAEGINAQISLPRVHWDEFTGYINRTPMLAGVRLNTAIDDDGRSFFKLKILVRRKIVADGLDDRAFDVTAAGTKVDAVRFNELTDASDTIVVDMRNHYESEVGRFQNALCPDADAFREALPVVEQMLGGKEHRNIVLYCTGGIRCEKASAWLKHKGFQRVHQLDGGIIEYARQVREKGLTNKFKGKNFVFDQRLGERVSETVISTCHQCGKPCDTHTNCRNDGCHLLFIQCEECARQYDGCCSAACAEVIKLPADLQRKMRSGKKQDQRTYRKARRPQWEPIARR